MVEGKVIQLFINSKLEGEMLLEETKFEITNAGSLYFGGDPWHTAYYTVFIDEIKLSNATFSCKGFGLCG